MKRQRSLLLILLFSTFVGYSFGQSDIRTVPIDYSNYKEFCAILHDGVPIVEKWNSVEELALTQEMSGILTVSKIDRDGKKFEVLCPVGFKLGIRNHRTNALWMYSDKTLQEISVDEILKECEMGDQLIFITVKKSHQLPMHVVRVNSGC